jgi:hypothetical protein
MHSAELPYIDEHTTVIAGDVEDVWPVLVDTVDRAFSRTAATACTTIVGCADRTAAGPRPLAAGSTTPGFRVAGAVPGVELALEGRHRFSTYALTFRLENLGPGRSRLRAETRAEFPGVSGGVYRLLVIGTRGHAVGMRHLLRTVKRRTEMPTRVA